MRKTQAIIHIGNLRHNLGIIQNLCPNSKLCLSVKADAYGHGAVPIARAALEEGVSALGVATTEEALELREAGIGSAIILYGIATNEELEILIEHRVELFCTDAELMATMANIAEKQNRQATIHLKVDTGMGRIGCPPNQTLDLVRLAKTSQLSPWIRLVGICTHLPLSEDSDTDFTQGQISRFAALIDQIRAAGFDPGLVHAANSGGIALHPQSHFDMVRPGIMAYGYPPAESGLANLGLKPVMELRSAISFIKRVTPGTPVSYGHRWTSETDTWIGTLAIGYADGLHRLSSGKFSVISASAKHPQPRYLQVGTICMDQSMINLGPAAEDCPMKRWDDIVVFGPQPGAETAQTLAAAAGTIPYEICCNISKRVPRVYSED